ncbi:zinc finger protein 184 isoform X2 [Notolabrus celidotus]|uniref:zinc finger protein 184 isoform X2 n=1 Tax=Notolabrus celidotus TaxID=1203425 RepID=UPI0014905828|nr:zinc finger protein 184 isoform X2 [Notolabrus celidotus]
MDEAVGAAAAAVREDGAEMRPPNGDPASGDSKCPAAESNSERVGVFCCQDCGETFSEEAAYTEHCHQHSDKKNDGAEKDTEKHFCTLCSLSFVGPSEFHSHMEKTHGEASQKQPDVQQNPGTSQHTYECPDCGKCYEVFGHFLNHQRSHRQASKSVFHDLEHLKKKSFQCESCGRSYSRASALDAHRRCHEEKLVKARNKSSGDAVHTEESTVEAKPSPKQTDNTPEKKYKCSCGKAFTALMRLKTHQRFSRNSQCSPEDMIDKPKKAGSEFQCTECNKTFSSHIALFNHQRWHSNFSSDPSKKFPCELCGKAFVTLSFYYRHQRTVHSDETPAKSFLHQVCQLQKKAFECKDCGLKFSRESALHSHQLLHTDNFRETEIGQTPLHPEQNTLESERKDTEQEEMKPEDVLFTSASENEVNVDETDEDVECYGPGDFNVQVISASESEGEEEEEESVQDLNPDLELLCESDQEQRDDGDTGPFASRTFSKPELDLKIVQIDFEPADVQCAPIEREPEGNSTGERFDCPDCYRWFTSASSLRVHRMWHGIRKRKHQTQDTPRGFTCAQCGLKFINWRIYKTHLRLHTEAWLGENRNPAAQLDLRRENDGENIDNDTGDDENVSRNPSELIQGVRMDRRLKKKKRSCIVCGKVYKYLSSFLKHQQQHKNDSPEMIYVNRGSKYGCADCGRVFGRKARLLCHMRTHRPRAPVNLKSLKCDQCNKSFTNEHSWKNHIELHKQKPFWCLSCPKGFFNEQSLKKHQLRHNQRKHTCSICSKSFILRSHLTYHHNTHTGAKPFQCTVCGKAYAHPMNLITHRKKHARVYAGSSGMHLGLKKAIVAKKLEIKKQRLTFTRVTEERDTNMSELPGKGECMEERRGEKKTGEDAEFGDSVHYGGMKSRAPEHHFKISKALGLDAVRSETFQPRKKEQVGQKETQERILYEDHKYCEWECCVCDMGFDEVAELHMHYIKHATGELPIPHDDL